MRPAAVGGLLVGAAAVAYFGHAQWLGRRYAGWENQTKAAQRIIHSLGEQHGKELLAGGLTPLKEACAGKLAAGGPLALVGYTAGDDEKVGGVISGLRQDLKQSPTSVYRFTDEIAQTKYIGEDLDPMREGLRALDPMTWGYKQDPSGAGGEPEVRLAKYLAVTAAREVTWPEERGELYVPGRARLVTRVVTLPDGKAVCEGETSATKKGAIEGSGRGKDQAAADSDAARSLSFHIEAYFIQAIHYRPLAELCEPFGKIFCEKVSNRAGSAL